MGTSHQSNADVDVLMLTHQRPEYTRLALGRLLESVDHRTNVWVWHNGSDEATLGVVHSLREHPRFHRFHHSAQNLRLREPTNWFYREARGALLGKVDDDCLMPDGWISKLRAAHEANPRFGVIGCWRFQDEDYDDALASPKIKEFAGGWQLLQNFWIEGSGYLVKRDCLTALGPIRERESFTSYCIRAARMGWIHGWVVPFIRQEHMDDPRAAHTGIKVDADLTRFRPLSAKKDHAMTVAEWDAQLRRSARIVQGAPIDPAYWSPWRQRVRNFLSRARARSRSRS